MDNHDYNGHIICYVFKDDNESEVIMETWTISIIMADSVGVILGWVTSLLDTLGLTVYIKTFATIAIVVAFWHYFITKRG
jgi:hypothetical protein